MRVEVGMMRLRRRIMKVIEMMARRMRRWRSILKVVKVMRRRLRRLRSILKVVKILCLQTLLCPHPSCALSKSGNRAIFDVFRQIITITLLFFWKVSV